MLNPTKVEKMSLEMRKVSIVRRMNKKSGPTAGRIGATILENRFNVLRFGLDSAPNRDVSRAKIRGQIGQSRIPLALLAKALDN